jgi:deoxyribonuclease V
VTPLPSEHGPVAITDVHYLDAGARAAVVVATAWSDASAIEERTVLVDAVAPYRPGAFFERELPCLLAVLRAVSAPLGCVVVDGYVELDTAGSPGLGAHLHEALGGTVPVLGIAKTAFRGASFAVPVLRGRSRSPLFVTARGLSRDDAERLVRSMHGPHRLPTLVQRADHLARNLAQPVQRVERAT